jgi:hypothetical protein
MKGVFCFRMYLLQMKYVITERQYKTITEQWWNDPKHPEWKKYAPTDYEKRELKKGEEFLNNLNPHTLMTVLAIGTAFIPVAGPFISASIGLADAGLYYKEGDTKAAGLTAAFSMIPFIGKIPGVKELGSKGMAALASKISKGIKSFSPAETKVLTAIEQNQSVIKQGLEKASEALKPVVKSVESFKPKYIAKYGQQRYDELLQGFISGKTTKEIFLDNLKSASASTYGTAKMTVQGGIKFAKSELNQLSKLVPLIKQGKEGTFKLELIVNGLNKEVDVYVKSFPGKTFAGQAIGRDKIYMNLDNLAGKSEGEIRQVLNHEATHIKDPSLVSSKLNKSYEKIKSAKQTELSKYETAYAKASETGKGADDAIKAGEKYQDLYQRYRYHPQEIVANNQMILNNMTSEMESLISKVGPNGAKKELDNLIGYVSGKNSLSKESLELLGDKGSSHLTGLYKYNKKYYNDFLKKIAKQSEYLKSQLNLMK